MFRNSYKCSGAVSKCSEAVISLQEQLVSVPEQLGYADFLHTMTLIRFHTLGTNISDILIEIHIFSSRKTHLKVPSAKCRLFCLGLDVLKK